MDHPPIAEPGGPDGPPLTKDQLLLGVIGGPGICKSCGKWIVQLEAGHWRSDEKDHADDRIVCKESDDGWHHPIGEVAPSGPAKMRRVSPPWSRPAPGHRTGEPL
jgi:hypothetical protein